MKPFLILVVISVAIGVGLGGAFFAGVSTGRGEAKSSVSLALPTPTLAQSTDQSRAGSSEFSDVSDLRERFRSGGLSQEEIASLREQFQQSGVSRGAPGSGFMGRGGRGGAGLSGSIKKIEGDRIVVETAQGPLEVTSVKDTVVRLVTDGGLSDLSVGMTVTVSGQRSENGEVEANVISVIPEGLVDQFGRPESSQGAQ